MCIEFVLRSVAMSTRKSAVDDHEDEIGLTNIDRVLFDLEA